MLWRRANEVDVVMNLGYLRDRNYEDLCDELIEPANGEKPN